MTARRIMPPGGTRARLLAAACLHPLPAVDLLTRAEARIPSPRPVTDQAARNICRWHAQQGHLHLAERGHWGGSPHRPNLYTLTPLGEAKLDELHAEVQP